MACQLYLPIFGEVPFFPSFTHHAPLATYFVLFILVVPSILSFFIIFAAFVLHISSKQHFSGRFLFRFAHNVFKARKKRYKWVGLFHVARIVYGVLFAVAFTIFKYLCHKNHRPTLHHRTASMASMAIAVSVPSMPHTLSKFWQCLVSLQHQFVRLRLHQVHNLHDNVFRWIDLLANYFAASFCGPNSFANGIWWGEERSKEIVCVCVWSRW